ncbi:MAG: hypothetical protein J6A96_00810 [Clostridia bacterium]|nr:hypothetical protein [Clostridia bacterium]
MFGRKKIKELEAKIAYLMSENELQKIKNDIYKRDIETLKRKVEIVENNQKPLHTPFEKDDGNELEYKDVLDQWLNGEEKK